MKIIDKKGKLFGKLSVFDILLIIIIAAVAVFAVRFLFKPKADAGKSELIYTITVDNQRKGTEINVKPGDKLYNKIDKYELGEIISVATEEKTEELFDEETGKANIVSHPVYQNIKVTLKGSFTVKADGYYYNQKPLRVNDIIYVTNQNFSGSGIISGISRRVSDENN